MKRKTSSISYDSIEVISSLNSSMNSDNNNSNLLNKKKKITLKENSEEEYKPIEKVDTFNIFINLIPNIFNQFMHFLQTIIFSHYLGSVDDLTLLTSVNLGFTYIEMFFYFIGFGIVQGMAVFCPNSFSQKNYILIGIQTNLVRIILTLFFIFYSLITYFLGGFLYNLLGVSINTEFGIKAFHFSLYTLIGVFFEIQFEVYCKFCESQLFYKPIIHTLIVSIISNYICCYFLLYYFRLGLLGAILSKNIVDILKFIWIHFSVLYYNPYPKSNFWFSRSYLNWEYFKEVLKICFLSALVCYSEFLGFSFSKLFSVRLSEISFAEYIVLSNVYLFTYPISLGVNNTMTILVSYFFGLNEPQNLYLIIKLILFYSTLLNIGFWSLFIIFRTQMTRFFTESKEIYLSNKLFEFYILNSMTQIFDTLQNGVQGALRGLELLDFLSYIIMPLFIICLPSGIYIFAFKLKFDVSGIFLAEVLVYFMEFAFMYIYLNRVDVPKLCLEQEKKREKEEKIEMEEIN